MKGNYCEKMETPRRCGRGNITLICTYVTVIASNMDSSEGGSQGTETREKTQGGLTVGLVIAVINEGDVKDE